MCYFTSFCFSRFFSFWWGVGGKKKAAFAANLWEVGDFCVDYNPDNTAIAIDRDYWVLGVEGFEKSLTGIDNKLLKVASLSPSSFATTNFPLIASTWGSTSIAIPSGMLSPAGDVMESPLTSNQNESSEHSTVVSYHRSIALRWYGSTASIHLQR